MIPILYEAKTNDFTGNGTGFLRDATECTVKERKYRCSNTD